MRVESYPAQSVPPKLLRQVAALREEAWPTAGGDRDAGPVHNPALRPVSMLLTEADMVVAAGHGGRVLLRPGAPPCGLVHCRIGRYPGDIDRLW